MSAVDILIITILLVLALVGLGLLLAGAGMTVQALTGRDKGLPQAWFELERQWHIERLVYRHHRISGILILAAAAFFFWQFTTHGVFSAAGNWQPLALALAVGNAINALIGLVILFRPSGLKPIETAANRWFAVDTHHLGEQLRTHPRLRGLLIVLVALILLSGALLLLGERIEPV